MIVSQPNCTPQDRLRAVERHAINVASTADALAGVAALAHYSGQSETGFLVGILADRLADEAQALLAACNGGAIND